MASLVKRRDVAAAPAEVFAVLADFGEIAHWARFIQHSCLLTDQGQGIGTRRRVQMPRQALVETVTVWDEPNVLGYAISGLPPIVGSVTNTWSLSPSGAATMVALTTHIESGRLPHQRLIARRMLERMALASELMLAGLAERVEPNEEADT